MRGLLLLSLAALPSSALLSGCGDDDDSGDGAGGGQSISCEWLMGDNCWRAAVDAFAGCASDASGTFDANRSVCTTTDGGVITFGTPVPADVDFDYLWDIRIENGGTSCGHYESLPNDSGVVLTTPMGETRVDSGASGQVFTCSDGSKFSLPFDQALSCLFELPGIAWSQSASLSVSLTGADDGQLLSCSDP